MDAVVIGLLSALTLSLGMVLWHLLVHPEIALSWWTGDPWEERSPGAITALRCSVAAALVASAFLTGLATAFLSRTG